VGDAEQGHKLLLRSPRTETDPWLVAAEIAVANMAGRPAEFVKVGRELLDRLPSLHTTELAASLATIELDAGQDRRARRLFEASLIEPNDNSLAQAEWASNQLQLPELETKLELVPSSYEAKALDYQSAGRPQEAVSQAALWLADEAFSSRAAAFGSYEASKAADFIRGADFARKGLIANPDDATLLNNLAFCLAKLGRVAEAESAISRIGAVDFDADPATIMATKGLIAFRSGDITEGTELYVEAIRSAKAQRRKMIAFIMFAAELMRVDPRTEGPEAVREVNEQVEKSPDTEARAWLKHLPRPSSLSAG
jgi:tetratricopeptide (TPR) repeat protein